MSVRGTKLECLATSEIHWYNKGVPHLRRARPSRVSPDKPFPSNGRRRSTAGFSSQSAFQARQAYAATCSGGRGAYYNQCDYRSWHGCVRGSVDSRHTVKRSQVWVVQPLQSLCHGDAGGQKAALRRYQLSTGAEKTTSIRAERRREGIGTQSRRLDLGP
jgi:hypothetical protein